ncbi:MAG: undecaprenyl-diphosphate phosphatase [Burkholderiales bacterium]|nr:undecaprenyl-diphosphate phosphatase [Burkholderiales bacterium]ODU72322.1 MAG: undecaprenyl-diphosphatase [Lautropia sp. SCN 66-9]
MFELLYALPLLVKAVILGIVEGLTEFLPISSTGHLILASSLLGFSGEKEKMFSVAIQTGAMFSVIWYYRERIAETIVGLRHERRAQRFALNVIIAFLPAAVLGVLFGKYIKAYLFKPVPVALAFIIGAFIILWVESRQRRGRASPRITDIDALSATDAVKLGIAQSFALIPGTSRSGATIIGGMMFGLSRKVATEFSFFLAIPTLIGAGIYDTWKYRDLLSLDDAPLFAVGLLFAFFSALACVHWLIRYVASHDFVPFAWYRIVFGVVVLVTAWAGWVDWVA